MKIVADGGIEINLEQLKVINVQQGDVLIYRPAVKTKEITAGMYERLLTVVRFLEASLVGVHVLMIPEDDQIEVVKEG